MEARGRLAAGDRGALRVSPRRRGTTTSWRSGRRAGCCRRCGWSSTTRCARMDDGAGRGDRADRACGAGRDGRAVPAAGAGARGVRVKALVTGAAGFIGSHLTEALLDRGAEVVGLDCFTDYYPRAIKERNLAVNAARRGSASSRRRSRRPTCAALLDGVTHVFHLAAQAGVRKSWGKRLPDLHRRTTSTRRSACSKRASGGRSRSSSTPRARRSTATRVASRCARTRCPSRCRRTA